jgi:hypothetical protein
MVSASHCKWPGFWSAIHFPIASSENIRRSYVYSCAELENQGSNFPEILTEYSYSYVIPNV